MVSILDQTKPTLSFDIIGYIVDQLAFEGDTKSLRLCSVMTHDILHLCRNHLFRTFDMRKKRITEEENILIKFYSVLSINPHLIPYVRIVHILDLNSHHPVTKHQFLPRLLQLLTQIETFRLHVMKTAPWATLGPVLHSSMTAMVARSTFTGLYLEGITDIYPSFFNSCRFLKLLNLNSSSLKYPFTNEENLRESEEPKSISASNSDEERIHLDIVNFSNCSLFLLGFKHYLNTSQLLLDFSRVRDIKINFSPTNFDVAWKIIHSARTTLEALKFSQSYTEETGLTIQTYTFMLSSQLDAYRELLPHVTLAPMHRLRHLSFAILIHDLFQPLPSESVGEWCLLLKTAPPGIMKLAITIDLFFLPPEDVTKLFSRKRSRKSQGEDTTLLTELDETLSSTQIFPSLSEVTLELQLPEDPDDSSDSEYAGQSQQPSLTSGEIRTSVKQMMRLTRKRLGPFGADAFIIHVEIGN